MGRKTIEQLNLEIEQKEKELENLIKEKEERLSNTDQNLPIEEIWQPKKNETYYYVDERNYVECDSNDTTHYDDERMECGNCYQTEEKTQFEAKREKFTRLFRQYVEQHSEPLDWGNFQQPKCFCYYNRGSYIEYDYNLNYKIAFVIYASSKEILEDAINFIGENNFKKYILEIEE